MQKGNDLQFDCITCQRPVKFSVFQLDNENDPVECSHCEKQYILNDETLKRQLHKFQALCRQIVESEEILGSTSVGIDVGDKHVKIPYKLLLSRLNSSIDLMIGETPLSITFRLEPTLDFPKQGIVK